MKKFTLIILAITLILTLFTGCTVSDSPSKVSPSPSDSTDLNSNAHTTPGISESTARLGETLDYQGLQLTFDSIENYVDNSGFALDKPSDGKLFIVLWFTASNTTGEDLFINMFLEDSYCDDFGIDPVSLLFNIEGAQLWGNVAAGKKSKGYVAYEVPENWETLEFQYTPEVFGSQSSKMIFIATKDNLT